MCNCVTGKFKDCFRWRWESAFWASATAQQAVFDAYYKKVEKAFLGLCNCATEIVNHGRLILILCLVIQGMQANRAPSPLVVFDPSKGVKVIVEQPLCHNLNDCGYQLQFLLLCQLYRGENPLFLGPPYFSTWPLPPHPRSCTSFSTSSWNYPF